MLLWGSLALAAAVVAVVLVVVLAGGLGVGGSGKQLDVASAEAGVAQILGDPSNGYGANDVGEVVCNGGRNPAIEAGAGFSCDVQVNGNARRVEVIFSDDEGTYSVDGPR